MDATTITVPLWSIVGSASITAGVVIWAFSTFEKKEDARVRDKRIDSLEILLSKISQDVSYIRGKLESRE